MKSPIFAQVSNRRVRLKVHMLLSVRFELALVNGIGLGKPFRDISVFAMDFTKNVASRILDSRSNGLLPVGEEAPPGAWPPPRRTPWEVFRNRFR